ncbi:MAG: hypothetical protein SVM80_13485, partial [Halobacteriota archaeon]|nr:hypothetical protein [Halobacteriota archaeon]MDY6966947.1 hypothetical protein [Halobacteriota archaeon]
MKGTAIFEFPDEGVLRCYVHDFDLPIKCKRLVKGGKPGVIIEGRITNPSNILFTVLNEYVEISNSPNSKTFSFTFVERLVEQTNEFQMT